MQLLHWLPISFWVQFKVDCQILHVLSSKFLQHYLPGQNLANLMLSLKEGILWVQISEGVKQQGPNTDLWKEFCLILSAEIYLRSNLFEAKHKAQNLWMNFFFYSQKPTWNKSIIFLPQRTCNLNIGNRKNTVRKNNRRCQRENWKIPLPHPDIINNKEKLSPATINPQRKKKEYINTCK